MDLQALTDYCLSKKGAYEDYPFGPEPRVIKVASKMFALMSEKDGTLQISLKCEPFLAESLRQQYASVQPGYHLNKTHWNTITVDGSIINQELLQMIDHSYDVVVQKLTKAEKSNLEV